MGKVNDSIVFASESCAIDAIGGTFIRDIEPGEIVVADKNGVHSLKDKCGEHTGLCIFEYIYFARPDSTIDGASVHLARQEAGRYLAMEHPVDADLVIGVPDSGLDAALGYSMQSDIPYGIGLIKNRYIGRTFIQPTQGQREISVRIKLNAMRSAIKGKRIVMVDDSIVRGTTSRYIVSLLREAGAKEVHMRISSPPFLYPCYFGTDVSSRETLIANLMTIDEIAKHIGVDSLGYLSIDNLKKIPVGAKCDFCDGCFSGKYPIGIPEGYSSQKTC
jgi:amidophosphoribosyltransferase